MTYQIVKYTFVKLPLGGSALPELLIVVVQACPVLSELLQTVLIYVFKSIDNLH